MVNSQAGAWELGKTLTLYIIMNSILSNHEIKCVADALEILKPNGRATNIFNVQQNKGILKIWFRGQANIKWDLAPKIFRIEKGTYLYAKQERGLYLDFLVTQAKYRLNHTTTFDWLSLMQHYGLPTRLLDWTENILIALYFAVLDAESPEKNDACLYALNRGALNEKVNVSDGRSLKLPETLDVALRLEVILRSDLDEIIERIRNEYKYGYELYKEYIDLKNNNMEDEILKKIVFPIAVYPYRINERMTIQQSVFTLHGGLCKDPYWTSRIGTVKSFDELVSENQNDKEKILISFKIPSDKKLVLKQELEKIGIHEGSIFPELEHQASFIAHKWKREI